MENDRHEKLVSIGREATPEDLVGKPFADCIIPDSLRIGDQRPEEFAGGAEDEDVELGLPAWLDEPIGPLDGSAVKAILDAAWRAYGSEWSDGAFEKAVRTAIALTLDRKEG